MSQRSVEVVVGEALLEIGTILTRAGRELTEIATATPASPTLSCPPLSPVPSTANPHIQQVTEFVIERVCHRQGVLRSRVESNSKRSVATKSRWLCWYILRRTTRLTLSDLAGIFNHHTYDHTTVLHGLSRIDTELTTKPQNYLWVTTIIDEVGELITTPSA